MQSPYASPVASSAQPAHGVWWVLRAAAALLAIAAWLVLLLHVLLLVRAELRLQQVLEDANRFAKLPDMSTTELGNYTHRRLMEEGFCEGKITLARGYAVAQIDAKPAGRALAITEVLTTWLTPPARLQSGGPPDSGWPFLGH